MDRKSRDLQEKLCSKVSECRARNEGVGKLSFQRTVYAAATVKRPLVAAQHGKCCYCESKVAGDCDVEHFRPKAAVCQGKGHPVETPGYYWLAFEWTNLLLACKPCNQLYKKNFFPLADPSRRARAPEDDLTAEEPLLIDPATQNPEDFISFREEIPFPVNGNLLGRTAMEVLQLHKREDLNERRRDRLEFLQKMYEIVLLALDDPDDPELQAAARRAERLLAKAVTDASEFAAMARAAARAGYYAEN